MGSHFSGARKSKEELIIKPIRGILVSGAKQVLDLRERLNIN